MTVDASSKDGPNYPNSWVATKPGHSTITLTIRAKGKRVVLGVVYRWDGFSYAHEFRARWAEDTFREGVIRAEAFRHGAWQDSVLYGLLRTDAREA